MTAKRGKVFTINLQPETDPDFEGYYNAPVPACQGVSATGPPERKLSGTSGRPSNSVFRTSKPLDGPSPTTTRQPPMYPNDTERPLDPAGRGVVARLVLRSAYDH